MCAAAAAEPGDQLLLGQRQLGRGEPQRRCGAAQEVHPGAAGSPAHRRVPQHLQRRQRSATDPWVPLVLEGGVGGGSDLCVLFVAAQQEVSGQMTFISPGAGPRLFIAGKSEKSTLR